jgi:hypothetical protein
VEYNTSTNPTFEGAVRDTSGRGNDGIMRFGATYDATKKSLEFPLNPATSSGSGNRDSIETGPTLDGTQLVKGYSVSTWFRADSQAAWEQVWVLGKTGLGKHEGLWLSGSATISIHTDFSGGMNYYYPCNSGGNWKHVTFVRKGTTSSNHDVYVDGVRVTASSTANGTAVQAFEKDSNLVLGENIGRNAYGFDGAISNFKLYDTALTAQEVKTLYDMGRCDEGHHVVNFSKTRVGIGLGDGEAPRAALDVRGDILYTGTSRPHALPTMWHHMDMGRNGPGVYPIIGTQGGSKVYNVYCEPDIFGGGWMCFTQIPQGGGGFNHNIVNLYTFDSGDSGNLKRTKFFNVPYNILSNTNGVNCDILVLAYGDVLRYNMQGAKVGAIWRGVDLNTHFNSVIDQSQIAYNAAQATSADGITFTSLSANLDHPSQWEFSISTAGNTTGSYNNYDDGTGGFIIHTGTGQSYEIYGHVRGPDGNWNYSASTDFEIVRIFVRPSQF